jgi:hypothetical protein
VFEQKLDDFHMILVDHLVEGSVPQFSRSIDICARSRQCPDVLHVAANGGNVKRALTESSDVVHACQAHTGERREVFLFVSAEHLFRRKLIETVVARSIGHHSQFDAIHSCILPTAMFSCWMSLS